MGNCGQPFRQNDGLLLCFDGWEADRKITRMENATSFGKVPFFPAKTSASGG
jgi:hypothetical protein